jgi:hypothetical protein
MRNRPKRPTQPPSLRIKCAFQLPRPRTRTLPQTRVDLLQEIYGWADGKDGQDEQRIFWLNGLAGTGKSTISRTVAHEYNEQKRLGASFFFSKGGGDAGHAGKFFTSLAAQLAFNVPSLRQYIREAVKNRSDWLACPSRSSGVSLFLVHYRIYTANHVSLTLLSSTHLMSVMMIKMSGSFCSF